MSEHTEAGKAFIARVVHELVPTIERDFWQDDPHNGDVIQTSTSVLQANLIHIASPS